MLSNKGDHFWKLIIILLINPGFLVCLTSTWNNQTQEHCDLGTGTIQSSHSQDAHRFAIVYSTIYYNIVIHSIEFLNAFRMLSSSVTSSFWINKHRLMAFVDNIIDWFMIASIGLAVAVCAWFHLCMRQRPSWTYPPQVFTSVHLYNKIVRSRFTISSPLFQNNWVKIHHRENKVR